MVCLTNLEVVFDNTYPQRISGTLSEDQELADIVEKRLQTSVYVDLRTLRCEHHDGVLVLLGCVPSYYHKQIAQESVRDICGVQAIHNHLIVVATNGL